MSHPMKLILTQEVTGLGAPGDVVEVKDGYGRNYLVPRDLAIRWTRGAEKQSTRSSGPAPPATIRDLDDARDRGQARWRRCTVRLPGQGRQPPAGCSAR